MLKARVDEKPRGRNYALAILITLLVLFPLPLILFPGVLFLLNLVLWRSLAVLSPALRFGLGALPPQILLLLPLALLLLLA